MVAAVTEICLSRGNRLVLCCLSSAQSRDLSAACCDWRIDRLPYSSWPRGRSRRGAVLTPHVEIWRPLIVADELACAELAFEKWHLWLSKTTLAIECFLIYS
jgi:hypothetical protein